MESCPTQAVLPLVGLAAEKVIRDRYNWMRQSPFTYSTGGHNPPVHAGNFLPRVTKPSSRFQNPGLWESLTSVR
ncbi:MAG: hypothetical protein ACQESR_11920 [Planctomycetota bacterium]